MKEPRRQSVRQLSLLLTLLLCSLLLSATGSPVNAAPRTVSTPIVTTISPSSVFNDETVAVSIHGAGFVATPVITLNTCNAETAVLSDVAFVNSTTLTATIPVGLPEGTYVVSVINPDGQRSLPYTDFTVMRPGNTAFGPWTTTSAMTTGRLGFAAVAANGHMYAIGPSSVERAKINDDGSLGIWQVMGNALTTPRIRLAAIVVGNNLYALGGMSGSLGLNSVERAVLNSDGSIGTWQVISSMTTPRSNFAVIAVNGYLYALGGSPGEGPSTNTVERAELKADGSLGAWKLTTPMVMPRSNAVVLGQHLYALGGGDTSVERTVVKADGSLAPWQIVSSLITNPTDFAAVIAGEHLYILGGFYPCLYSTNGVEQAVINSDGSLGPWQLTASMSTGRSNFAAVVVNDRIYTLGGMSGWSGTAVRTVEYAPVRTLLQERFLPIISR